MEKKGDYIIAIGSSAGGLTPLKAFFDYTPSDQVSYVLLSHIAINYKSELKEILKRHSSINIQEVVDQMPIEKNTIYLLPSNKMMVMEDGRFFLMARGQAPLYPNWAINIFMQSMAADRKDKCIAVILSGSGSDGTTGASAIKNAGGMVIAQDPDSCEHPSMPESAIHAGIVDHILLPEQMPSVIHDYITEKMELEQIN
jgi:two-component system, chemotaxis family, CheB/CheR fusion protein